MVSQHTGGIHVLAFFQDIVREQPNMVRTAEMYLHEQINDKIFQNE